MKTLGREKITLKEKDLMILSFSIIERRWLKERENYCLRMSSGVENWRRPVGLLLYFPLPIVDEKQKGKSRNGRKKQKRSRIDVE